MLRCSASMEVRCSRFLWCFWWWHWLYDDDDMSQTVIMMRMMMLLLPGEDHRALDLSFRHLPSLPGLRGLRALRRWEPEQEEPHHWKGVLVVSCMAYVPISPFHQSWWPFPKGPSLVKGDGDGTVNIRSLEVLLIFWQFQTLPYMLWKPEYKYQSKGLLEVEGLPEAGRPPQGVQGDQPRGHAQKRYVVIIEILIILVCWCCNNSGWFAIERVVMI